MKFWRSKLFGQRFLVSLYSTFSNDFSSETIGPLSMKVHMQLRGEGVKKVYIFGSGHVIIMATFSVYGKNF